MISSMLAVVAVLCLGLLKPEDRIKPAGTMKKKARTWVRAFESIWSEPMRNDGVV